MKLDVPSFMWSGGGFFEEGDDCIGISRFLSGLVTSGVGVKLPPQGVGGMHWGGVPRFLG